jgi:WD40 repeat protein
VDQVTKRAFFRQLGELLGDRTVWALFSMREDFLAELDPYARLVPTRFTNRYRLDLLTEAEALDAVIFPARDAKVDFEPSAAGKLVDDLRTVRLQRGSQMTEELGPYVEPVQLQVVCRGVWARKEAGSTRIGLTDVEAVGDVDEALAGYYSDCMASTAQASGVAERVLREWCEHELITPQGFRGQAMHGPDVSEGSGERVLSLLTAAHLLRAESRRGAVWFELAHDRLIDPVKEDNEQWRRTNLSDVERRAALWEEQSRTDGLLLTGAELAEAEAWAAPRSGTLTEVERDFLGASRRLREQTEKEARANKRIRRWLAVAVVGFILAVIASGFAVTSTIRAGEATLRASEAAALGQSLGNLPEDVQLSLRLAVMASALRDSESGELSGEAMNVLQQAVDASPVRLVLRGTDSPAGYATHSSDGTRILSLHDDSTLRVWDAASGKLIWSQGGGDEFMAYAISPDGKRVATGAPDGVRLWEVGSSQSRQLVPGLGVDTLTFSPDGSWLVVREVPDEPEATVTPEEEVEVTDDAHLLAVSISSGASRDLRSGGGWDLQWSGQGAWSPKGARLVSVGDGRFKVWDSPTAEPRQVPMPEGAMDAVVSQVGEVVATQEEGRVAVYRGLGGRQMSFVRGDWGSMSLSRDGRLLLLSDFSDSVSVYDTTTGAVVRWASQAGTESSLTELNPTHPDRALVSGTEGELTVWDVRAGRTPEENVNSFSMGGDVGTVVTDAGIARFWDADGSAAGIVNLYSRLGIEAPNLEATAEDPDADPGVFITAVAPSPTGAFLAVATDQAGASYLVPVDPKTKPIPLELVEPTHAVVSLAVSRTGRYVVGGYTTWVPDEEVVDTGEPVLGGLAPGEPVPEPTVGEPVTAQPEAPAEEDFDAGLYVWDAATGKALHHWPQELGEPFTIEISPDEREVVGFVQDGATIWDLATGKARLTIKPKASTPSDASTARPQMVPEMDGEAEGPVLVAMAWGSQGDLIAMSQDDGLLLLWDARTGALVGELKKHAGVVMDLAFDPTGRWLVSVGDDKMLVIWDVETRGIREQVRHENALWADFARTKRRVLVVGDAGLPSVVWLDGRELLDAAKARTTRELTAAECTRYLGEEDICSTG